MMKLRRARIHVVVVLASVFLSACGSDGGGGAAASCGKVHPCGGDLVGNWKVAGICANAAAIMAGTADDFPTCPDYRVDATGITASGTLSFKADMTFTSMVTIAGSEKLTLPLSCLNGLSCAEFNTAILTRMQQNPDPSIQSFTCAGSSPCVCTITPTPEVATESGTYTTVGNVLTTTPTGGVPDSVEYCVQGATAHFIELSMTMTTPMGIAVIDADIVSQKQ